jgi:hypothetical protein
MMMMMVVMRMMMIVIVQNSQSYVRHKIVYDCIPNDIYWFSNTTEMNHVQKRNV